MIIGTIKEFPNYLSWQENKKLNDFHLMFENGRIRHLGGNQEVLFKDDRLQSISQACGGVWCIYSLEKGRRIEFIDIFSKDLAFKPKNTDIVNRHWLGEKCVYVNKIDLKKSELVIHDYATNDKIRSNLDNYLKLGLGDNIIIGLSWDGIVYCFTLTCEELWRFNSNKEIFSRAVPMIVHYNKQVLVNVGIDPKSRNNGEIVSLNEEDGSKIWNRLFENEVTCILIQNKIYCASGGLGYVLDAESGNTLMKVEPNTDHYSKDDILWSDGRFIYYSCYEDSSFFIYNLSGAFLGRLKIPNPYSSMVGEFPSLYRDKIYLSVGIKDDFEIKGTSYGLLTLKIDKSDSELKIGDILILQKPEHYILIDSNEEGEGYHIIINDRDIEKVIRYGEILLQTYAQARGRHDFEGKRQNKNFNGLLYFSAPLYDSDFELERMAKRVEKWCAATDVYGSVNTNEIKVKIVPMPKIDSKLLANLAPAIA